MKIESIYVLSNHFFNHKQILKEPICLIFHVRTACLYSPLSDFDQWATALIQANVFSWCSIINKQYVVSYLSKFKFKIVSDSRISYWLYSELQTEMQQEVLWFGFNNHLSDPGSLLISAEGWRLEDTQPLLAQHTWIALRSGGQQVWMWVMLAPSFDKKCVCVEFTLGWQDCLYQVLLQSNWWRLHLNHKCHSCYNSGGVTKGRLLHATCTSVWNVMTSHIIPVELFQSEPDSWTDRQTDGLQEYCSQCPHLHRYGESMWAECVTGGWTLT